MHVLLHKIGDSVYGMRRILPPRTRRACRLALHSALDLSISPQVRPSDALVISGFMRSGTTWLQEAAAEVLNGKSVFEPLGSPELPDGMYSTLLPAETDWNYRHVFMPYAERDFNHYPQLKLYLEQSLRGRVGGHWVYRSRRRLSESLRSRVILKEVRAQLCLHAIQETFQVPILHVYRDPRAIIASLNKAQWDKLYHTMSLRAHFLEPRDGRAEFFEAWRDDIEQIDALSVPERIAAYWSLTECYVEHCRANLGTRIIMVGYEECFRDSATCMSAILDDLHRKPVHVDEAVINRDSRTTIAERRGTSFDARVYSWKKDLSPHEIDAITAVVERFGLQDRLIS